jgi:membrane associated rhomboid family serine protease
MGLHDRPYWRRDGGAEGWRGVRVGLPRPARAALYLLILNLVAFVGQILLPDPAAGVDRLSQWCGVTVGSFWQPWRYVTFQFLHGGIGHIFLNMLVLYMFGSVLERHWGSRRFVTFYLSCGAVAGLTYVVIGAIRGLGAEVPLIGASGGGYAILLACAVLFPHMRIIFFVFPMSMRTAALIIFAIAILSVLGGARAASGAFWSHVAHLGGAGMAAVWLWVVPNVRGLRRRTTTRINRGAWQRKLQNRQRDEA